MFTGFEKSSNPNERRKRWDRLRIPVKAGRVVPRAPVRRFNTRKIVFVVRGARGATRPTISRFTFHTSRVSYLCATGASGGGKTCAPGARVFSAALAERAHH